MKATDDEIRDLARRLASLLERPEPGLVSWLGLRAEVAGKLREALADRTGEGRPAGCCRDCRHWGDPDDEGEYRVCKAIVHDRRSYTSPCFDPGFEPIIPEAAADPARLAEVRAFRARHKAIVIDHEWYKAEARTREDFGCVLFEGKEGP